MTYASVGARPVGTGGGRLRRSDLRGGGAVQADDLRVARGEVGQARVQRHQQRRAGVGERVREPLIGVGGVQRDVGAARLQHAEERAHQLGPALQQHATRPPGRRRGGAGGGRAGSRGAPAPRTSTSRRRGPAAPHPGCAAACAANRSWMPRSARVVDRRGVPRLQRRARSPGVSSSTSESRRSGAADTCSRRRWKCSAILATVSASKRSVRYEIPPPSPCSSAVSSRCRSNFVGVAPPRAMPRPVRGAGAARPHLRGRPRHPA
jgi:hypothetical protein